MRGYLLFQLYGPLASFGEAAVGEARHSATHPSRSALLGLVAAAAGVRRDDAEGQRRLAESLRFGVKTLSLGSVLKDYHTTQVPPQERKVHHYHTRRDELGSDRLGTILSSREYRQDGLWLAAAWTDGRSPNHSLDELAKHLAKPVFQLYLGRKSCPLGLPLNPRIIRAESLKQAFDEYPKPTLADNKELALRRSFGPGQVQYAWETCGHSGFAKEDFRAPRHDNPLSRDRWQFGDREEYIKLQQEGG
jgi:CRISPR system Cascade subunit CasD